VRFGFGAGPKVGLGRMSVDFCVQERRRSFESARGFSVRRVVCAQEGMRKVEGVGLRPSKGANPSDSRHGSREHGSLKGASSNRELYLTSNSSFKRLRRLRGIRDVHTCRGLLFCLRCSRSGCCNISILRPEHRNTRDSRISWFEALPSPFRPLDPQAPSVGMACTMLLPREKDGDDLGTCSPGNGMR
jgi:hypothetical protein